MNTLFSKGKSLFKPLIGLLVIATIALSSNGLFISVVQAAVGTEVSGNITEDTTWTLANSPYTVVGTVQVLDGIALTIEPGVTVRFNSATGLNIGGELIAIGTADNVITFTSNQSTPKAGDWNGIKFFNTAVGSIFDSNYNYISGSTIRYAKIAYATYAPGYGDSTAALNGGNIPLWIDNDIIEYSQYDAVFINASKSKITNNLIRANSLGSIMCNSGIVSAYSNDLQIENNIIENNGDIGIYLYSSNSVVQNNKVTNNGCGIKVYGSNNEISSNEITGNHFSGIYYYGGTGAEMSSNNSIIGNTITQNQDNGIYIYKYNNASQTTITNNNIFNNANYNFKFDDSSANIDLPNNYWGTTDNASIANGIFDYYDSISLGKVNYEPHATTELDSNDQVALTDTSAPTVIVSGRTQGELLVVTWEIHNDPWPDLSGVQIDVKIDGNPAWSGGGYTVATPNPYTISYSYNLSIGPHTIETVLTDHPMRNTAKYTTILYKTTDTTAPVITLLGSSPINLYAGDTYTDAGATATDNVDGPVTVMVSGSVNTNAAGTYTITYTATDVALNVATKTRTVNVSPRLSSISISTPANKLTYTVGDPLDITGLVVTKTFSDNSTTTENITASNVSGFNSSAPAVSQMLTISVGEETTAYTVTVNAASVSACPSIISPTGGFGVEVSDNNPVQGSVLLTMLAGSDTTRMVISANAAFTDASVQTYAREIEWKLPEDTSVTKTIYVRFYNACGSSASVTKPFVHQAATVAQPASTSPTPPSGQVLGEHRIDVTAEEKGLMGTIDMKLVTRLAGRILLQVERYGQAWYLDVISLKRYYLEDGSSAYTALRKFGLGITNADLAKISVGTESRFSMADTDADGLPDKLEEALGTSVTVADTDGDGVSDGIEALKNSTNPLGAGKAVYSTTLANHLKGRILLQVESRGEAWYVNPVDGKRYYMTDGEAAYQIMRYLSLGITNGDIREIPVEGLE